MTTKEYLQRLEKLDTIINQKITEMDNLKNMLTFIGSFDYSKDRVQTSPEGDAPFVKTIEKICVLQEEINREIDNFVDEKHKIINQIQSLPKRIYIDILFKRYVEYKNFEKIAVETGYSYDHVIHLHGHALQEFEKLAYNSI